MTPRLANIAIFERMSQAREDRGWLAWTTAALGRVKPAKFPKLERVMGTLKRRKKAQTWQEQLELARTWVRAVGGEIKSAEDE